ncbi:uncharacterized protein MONOS_2089 [Monocercomonoides exilis]|uniref:uncharacterized protein n=1 Tax=Monocercomonoides exilis TaxID=2049356 RepID=UPI00355A4F09|nr:hypothetical protein MONOS_2089 [Monocercomonoides exilis]|eukprot:MONOS_2089.1-p1 / transcript=MONOS_2089.1 / gene=MONOS_2089 / organism=Monocercomonoides_exilis_PA203 / gene_product=unspecified product / transcript_product=unspecified product / location=Mono_scaffold00041:24741-25007(-) / protein_length=89 / sequence_SO=supercontig / SO=protein_coding / is_pseudo=false
MDSDLSLHVKHSFFNPFALPKSDSHHHLGDAASEMEHSAPEPELALHRASVIATATAATVAIAEAEALIAQPANIVTPMPRAASSPSQ